MIGKKKNRIPLKKITLELTPNKEYFFEVIDDSIKGADLKRIKEASL
ncbi:hypothetical protein GCM10026983_19650 [Gracilibacillus alcaliphilus]